VGPDQLVSRHAGAWSAATRHPFLDGVRDGSLPDTAFRAWLCQDHLFVADLLAFQARLLAVAPRVDQRLLAGGLVALEAELSWFEAEAAANGWPLVGPRHPTTEAYRSHLELLLTGRYAAALTALWALERAYLEGWSGARPGAASYAKYVAHWTNAEFAAYVARLEAAAGAALDSGGVEAAECERAFLLTAGLERDFWAMAWKGDG
jgi:thiaminase/transcriptional activator TenA